MRGFELNGEALLIADQFYDRLHVLEADGLGHLAAHALDRVNLEHELPRPRPMPNLPAMVCHVVIRRAPLFKPCLRLGRQGGFVCGEVEGDQRSHVASLS